MSDESTDRTPITKDEFIFEDELGHGAYSRVVLTTFKQTGKKYATKIIQKDHIIKEKKIKTVQTEKTVLNMMDHDNIIKLFCTYQDKENLYFALELAPGGEMFSYLSKYGPFSFEAARFYTAELVNGLEYMHSLGIVHRDMKPENVIFTKDMHAKITDFGTAKIKSEEEEAMKGPNTSRQTFCGTAEYVSPEVLNNQPCNEAADLWALGCMIYHFLAGQCPFKGESQYLIFQKILKLDFTFPDDFPGVARDIVTALLKVDPNDRLGCGTRGYAELKEHPFFEGINFNNLAKMTPPPIVPQELMQANTSGQENNDRWGVFLLKNEEVYYSRLVIKRRFLTAKKRQLILTDRPRILYIDPENMQMKGIVPWSKQLWIQKRTDKDFIIHTPNRKYVLESLDSDVDGWVTAIEAIQKRM